MTKRILSLVLVLASLLLLTAMPVSAASDGYADVTIYGTQDYDEVNDVFQRVNKERTAAGLPELTLDPVLTANAMQRAAEIAVYYSHTRPNGSSWSTAIDSRFANSTRGENIAIGQADGRSVMTAWMNSAGHKANILGGEFTAIGIGCFYQDDGTRCWVQLFSSLTVSDAYSESGRKSVSGIPIQIAPANVTLSLPGIESCVGIKLYQGTSTLVRPSLGNAGYAYMTPVYMDGGYTLSVSDSSIAQVSPDHREVGGFAPGSCTLYIQVDDIITGSVPVTVSARPSLSSSLAADGSYILSWEDGSGDAYLCGKEYGDELWTILAYPQAGANTYTHYGVFAGEEWTYVLRIRNEDYSYVEISDRLVLVKLTAPEISISGDAATDLNKLTWEAHDGDAAYEVYRSDSADGAFTLLTTVTRTDYTDTNTEPGKTYYYKVCALGKGDSRSLFSNVVSRTCTAQSLQLKVTNVASSGKPKLTWDKVPGAVKYEIYRATSASGTYSRLSTTTGTSLTNTSATVGQTYYYKVRAVHEDGTRSEFSNIVSRTCCLPRPVVTASNVASSGKVKLTWEKIEGALKYQVYRSTDNENWSLLKTLTGTSLTNTSTEAGTLYYYKVKAIASNTDASSAFSTVKSRRCDLPRPEVTVTNVASTGKIKLTWGKITGAVKYQVYRSTDNVNWSLLKTLTGTSLTNTSTTPGTTYYYKVRAVHSNSEATSAYSAVDSRTCDLPRPTLTVKLNSAGNPKLSWTKVEGALKYQVYRSTDNVNWSLLKTLTGTSLTNTSVAEGTTYYYKVRAVHSVSAANSAYSTVQAITAE